MKYFTRELVERFGSEDDAEAGKAEALWDELGDRYVAYLDTVKQDMPAGLRHIHDSYYLHDADIRGIGRGDHSFVIVLQLDTPPQSILTFAYDLVEEPVIDRAALPAELRTPNDHVEWQYDELERCPGEPATWFQSILLSNGWEVKLHFRDVLVQETQALLPAPRQGMLPQTVPQSA